MKHVLYLHGFLSSPQSVKAQATQAWFNNHRPEVTLHIPQISNFPSAIKQQLSDYIAQHPELLTEGLRVIGSSMGGYLASYLVEAYGGKAVLINPAVRPYELLEGYLGAHVNPYTHEQFDLIASDMPLLQQLDTAIISQPQAYMVLLQTGDETLDYRQAEQKYQHSKVIVEPGGDHSFIGYAEYLPDIADFLA